MFRLLGFIIKTLVFSLVVIIASNWVHWRGRTLSDHVRLQLSHAERAPWVEKIPGEAREVKEWVGKRAGHMLHSSTSDRSNTSELRIHQAAALRPRAALASEDESPSSVVTTSTSENIPASERQKLKALIRELNSAQN